MRARTSAVSAICGTDLGETKLPASITLRPVLLRRSINSTLVAVGSDADSFCNPSRGATSTSLTDLGIRIAVTSGTRRTVSAESAFRSQWQGSGPAHRASQQAG